MFILVLLLGAWMAGAEYVWLCKVKDHCGGTPAASTPAADTALSSPQPAEPAGTSGLAQTAAAELPSSQPQPEQRTAPAAVPTVIEINGATALTTSSLGFDPDQWRITAVEGGAEYVDQLAGFLSARPALDATLTGQYFVFESTPSDAENLGQARATALKAALVSSGVAADRLTVDSSLLMDSERKPGFEIAAVDFSRLANTRYVYFQPAAVTTQASPELEGYVREVSRFLQRHRGASVTVIGHTDNTGVPETNETLGLSRARSVAEMLSSMGLPTTRLRIGSRGQSQPVADNNTEAGRSANRRVEIQLDFGRR